MNNNDRKTNDRSLVVILALITILFLKLSFIHTISWKWPIVMGSTTFIVLALQEWWKEKDRRKDLS